MSVFEIMIALHFQQLVSRAGQYADDFQCKYPNIRTCLEPKMCLHCLRVSNCLCMLFG